MNTEVEFANGPGSLAECTLGKVVKHKISEEYGHIAGFARSDGIVLIVWQPEYKTGIDGTYIPQDKAVSLPENLYLS